MDFESKNIAAVIEGIKMKEEIDERCNKEFTETLQQMKDSYEEGEILSETLDTEENRFAELQIALVKKQEVVRYRRSEKELIEKTRITLNLKTELMQEELEERISELWNMKRKYIDSLRKLSESIKSNTKEPLEELDELKKLLSGTLGLKRLEPEPVQHHEPPPPPPRVPPTVIVVEDDDEEDAQMLQLLDEIEQNHFLKDMKAFNQKPINSNVTEQKQSTFQKKLELQPLNPKTKQSNPYDDITEYKINDVVETPKLGQNQNSNKNYQSTKRSWEPYQNDELLNFNKEKQPRECKSKETDKNWQFGTRSVSENRPGNQVPSVNQGRAVTGARPWNQNSFANQERPGNQNRSVNQDRVVTQARPGNKNNLSDQERPATQTLQWNQNHFVEQDRTEELLVTQDHPWSKNRSVDIDRQGNQDHEVNKERPVTQNRPWNQNRAFTQARPGNQDRFVNQERPNTQTRLVTEDRPWNKNRSVEQDHVATETRPGNQNRPLDLDCPVKQAQNPRQSDECTSKKGSSPYFTKNKSSNLDDSSRYEPLQSESKQKINWQTGPASFSRFNQQNPRPSSPLLQTPVNQKISQNQQTKQHGTFQLKNRIHDFSIAKVGHKEDVPDDSPIQNVRRSAFVPKQPYKFY